MIRQLKCIIKDAGLITLSIHKIQKELGFNIKGLIYQNYVNPADSMSDNLTKAKFERNFGAWFSVNLSKIKG